ncbi:MAG TPA: M48 family metallopeptidase [Dokdonella sp.]|nr:M48 family metallopeptidase [Dokdonella sp.]
MNARRALYFDGRSSRAHAVEVAFDGAEVELCGDGVARREPVSALRITPRLGRTPRTLLFADGAQLVLDDAADLDAAFASADRVQSWVDRIERHWRAVALAAAISVVAGALLLQFGVPWAAERIARRMPATVESGLGRTVLDQLDRWAFEPSALPQARRDTLSRRFADLLEPGEDATMRLAFRNAPKIGANAFALPGGTIVVTDQFVARVGDEREFLAVAAHELGHERHRHTLRQALQGSAVAVLAALFAGDVSSAGSVVVAVPTFLLDGHYSRAFESEADDAAFATLVAHGISPRWFATIMRKLEGDTPHEAPPPYLSSHPPTDARIALAERLADRFEAASPPQRAASH